MASLPKIEIINVRGEKIDLGEFAFQNFRYTEDINLGFPMIEFSLQDNLYQLLKERLYGDEILRVIEFQEDSFKIMNKEFKIKSFGSLGEGVKISSRQNLKLIAVDKIYDNIIKNTQSIYFLPAEKKIITDLIKKFLKINGIVETNDFKINIPVPTIPLKEKGFYNLYIPYSKDALKVIRKLANYSVSSDNRGGYIFFINRYGLYFIPVYKLFEAGNPLNYKSNDTNNHFPRLRITEENQLYSFKTVKLSTYNAFTNFVTGHEKRIFGFNSTQKDYNYVKYLTNATYKTYDEYTETDAQSSQVKLDGDRLPFLKEFSEGNKTSYYTPLDDISFLKAFGDNLYYAQMFNYNLDIELQGTTGMHDFQVGNIVDVEFATKAADRWDSLSGGWLLKTFDYIYPGNHISLKLTKMGSGGGKGILPDTHYTIIGGK